MLDSVSELECVFAEGALDSGRACVFPFELCGTATACSCGCLSVFAGGLGASRVRAELNAILDFEVRFSRSPSASFELCASLAGPRGKSGFTEHMILLVRLDSADFLRAAFAGLCRGDGAGLFVVRDAKSRLSMVQALDAALIAGLVHGASAATLAAVVSLPRGGWLMHAPYAGPTLDAVARATRAGGAAAFARALAAFPGLGDVLCQGVSDRSLASLRQAVDGVLVALLGVPAGYDLARPFLLCATTNARACSFGLIGPETLCGLVRRTTFDSATLRRMVLEDGLDFESERTLASFMRRARGASGHASAPDARVPCAALVREILLVEPVRRQLRAQTKDERAHYCSAPAVPSCMRLAARATPAILASGGSLRWSAGRGPGLSDDERGLGGAAHIASLSLAVAAAFTYWDVLKLPGDIRAGAVSAFVNKWVGLARGSSRSRGRSRQQLIADRVASAEGLSLELGVALAERLTAKHAAGRKRQRDAA
jgi:hypothetical protein